MIKLINIYKNLFCLNSGIQTRVKAYFVFLALSLPQLIFGNGNHSYLLRENTDDRFHSNESIVIPWRNNNAFDGYGRFQGNHSYEIRWSSPTMVGDGFTHNRPRDHQFYASTWIYLDNSRSIHVSGNGDAVPRYFIDTNFGSDLPLNSTVNLSAGWHQLHVTGYNQNSGYSYTMGNLASKVDIMNSEMVATPSANFSVSTPYGWSRVTPISLSNESLNNPDSNVWTIQGGGNTFLESSVDVIEKTFNAPDGGETVFDVSLEVSSLGFLTDEIEQLGAFTIFGKPVANFEWSEDARLSC